ncbi:MAG: phosphoenolpyruvate carboxykinase (GTP) [Candidatus Omnitrophica bacterium]|nr:phosphoenolpyruvate carboxykinase (GTP) [Candidatus Omnitrophota bacterium]MCF7878172.1 phosphoenolpyruvate carboxykinase (GTP) [Candidatus Omnitrophota bacterium]MCF7892608.1 phosphoenolpyruvate carboxykinase (GTP) [Candidatus Omnitrophota bacterium]
MQKSSKELLKERLDQKSFEKVAIFQNQHLFDFIAGFVELCNPKSVFVRTDSKEDIAYIREKAKELGEEKTLAKSGHTVHFDGYQDQARDKKKTKYLLSQDILAKSRINSIEKNEGNREIKSILKNIMQGKEMLICFFCLGPNNSFFSLPAVQITDSFYVAHSEDILYRPGYEQFKKTKESPDFFKFVHSAGELEGGVSKNIDKRRVYIDLEKQLVYSANTQYAGNTVGLKKLALRLAINKAVNQGWLAEHMFVMSVADKDGDKSYFCGAYPSMCGKTSTAMIKGETIVGDDIAYLKKRNSKVFGTNVERGAFGIIKGVNPEDDPIIYKTLSEKGEVIFSNILVSENNIPFWEGKSREHPVSGTNFSGHWFPGKTDQEGEEIPASHKNARFTIRIKDLENADENLNNPEGVNIKGMIYGGRDSDTSVPVEQAFNWQHGIITKAASIESETTAATLGKEGVRVFNPMSNIDFLSIPLSKYIKANLDFGKGLDSVPLIFSVNYFLRNKEGKFLNGMKDKKIWLKWAKLRADKRAEGLKTPTGLIPAYQDLKLLFKDHLGKDYSEEDYNIQFTLRIPENLEKIERVINIYSDRDNIPSVLFKELEEQKKRLLECQKEYGDYPKPSNFKK